MPKYRVVREDFFDEKGRSLKIIFFIQKQYSIFRIKWWKYIRYKNIGIKTLRKVPLHFENLYEAQDFIKDSLLNGRKYKGHHKLVMKEYCSEK